MQRRILFLFSKFSTTTITTATTTTITFQSFLYDANILRFALAETFPEFSGATHQVRCELAIDVTHTHGSSLILFDVILGVGGKKKLTGEKRVEKLGVELPKQLDNIARNVIIVPDIFLYFNSVSLFLFFCAL